MRVTSAPNFLSINDEQALYRRSPLDDGDLASYDVDEKKATPDVLTQSQQQRMASQAVPMDVSDDEEDSGDEDDNEDDNGTEFYPATLDGDRTDEDDDESDVASLRKPPQKDNRHPVAMPVDPSRQPILRRVSASDQSTVAASPLTELIRAFELLRSSPFMASTATHQDDGPYTSQSATEDAKWPLVGAAEAARKQTLDHAYRAKPAVGQPHTYRQAGPAWSPLRSRSMTSPEITRGASWRTSSPDAVLSMSNVLACKANGEDEKNRLKRIRSRRPTSLRIDTSVSPARSILPRRKPKTKAKTNSVPFPTASLLPTAQEGIDTSSSRPKEWIVDTASAEGDLQFGPLLQAAAIPTPVGFPVSAAQHTAGVRDATATVPTEAELSAAICPYPIDIVQPEPRRPSDHCRQPTEHPVHAWAVSTYNATRKYSQSGCDSHRLLSSRRTVSFAGVASGATTKQVSPTRIHFGFSSDPIIHGEPETERAEGSEGDDEKDSKADVDSLLNSPALHDPFILENRDLQSGCLSIPTHFRAPSEAFASDSSAGGDDLPFSAPPATGRAWHRGRRDALGARDMIAPMPYRPRPTLLVSATSSDEGNGKRRASASASMTTFRKALNSVSRSRGASQKRKPSHPTKSPYPQARAVMQSATFAAQSPPPRRPSTARGQRTQSLSIASTQETTSADEVMPWQAQDTSVAAVEPSARSSRIRSISNLFSLPKRVPSSDPRPAAARQLDSQPRHTSTLDGIFEGDEEERDRKARTVAALIMRGKRSVSTNSPVGLGLNMQRSCEDEEGDECLHPFGAPLRVPTRKRCASHNVNGMRVHPLSSASVQVTA